MIDRAKFFFAPAVVAAQLWGSAMAATPDTGDSSGSLEEVVVTATRRSERLQERTDQRERLQARRSSTRRACTASTT